MEDIKTISYPPTKVEQRELCDKYFAAMFSALRRDEESDTGHIGAHVAVVHQLDLQTTVEALCDHFVREMFPESEGWSDHYFQYVPIGESIVEIERHEALQRTEFT